MQPTSLKRRKCHFFADYFGKHFHCDFAKADEYGITPQTEDGLLFERLRLSQKGTAISIYLSRLAIDVLYH
jgi:hypothetical protein